MRDADYYRRVLDTVAEFQKAGGLATGIGRGPMIEAAKEVIRLPVCESPLYVGTPCDEDWPWSDYDIPDVDLVWLPCPNPTRDRADRP